MSQIQNKEAARLEEEIMEKQCVKCKVVKTSGDFYKKTLAKDGLQTECIVCQRAADVEYRKNRRANGPSLIKDSKVCQLCFHKKPISQFGKRSDSADGKLSYCKPCWTAYVKRAQKKKRVL